MSDRLQLTLTRGFVQSGTVDLEEMVIVHDSDKEEMIKILDQNNDGQVDKAEWDRYLDIKKKEKVSPPS